MQIGVVGINHKSSSLDLRERVTRALTSRFREGILHLFPHIVLITCNRSELYFSGPDLVGIHNACLTMLRAELDLEFEHALYSYFGAECFFHLVRVASGLDSAILGETEIQSQVKTAYREAVQKGSLSRELHYLFQRSLNLNKKVRYRLSLLPCDILESTLWDICKKELNQNPSVLFIGASHTNAKIIRFFKTKGIHSLALTNRSLERGCAFALDHQINWLPPSDFYTSIANYDLLVFATKSEKVLLNTLPKTSTYPLIFDLSLPRNVDPHLAGHARLYNIEQIQKLSLDTTRSPLKVDYDFIIQLVYKDISRFKRSWSRSLTHSAESIIMGSLG